MKTHLKVISLAATMFAIVGMMSLPTSFATVEHEGCGHGFYKNNALNNASDQYPLGETGDSMLVDLGIVNVPGEPGNVDISGMKVIDALKLKGGPGLEGAEQILLRAGVAALLNALHDDVNYETDDIAALDALNIALDENDRQEALLQAGVFAHANNPTLGCPLNNSGD